MSFDYYASLGERKTCSGKIKEPGLASGFVDECTVWSCQEPKQNKKEAPQKCYMKRAKELSEKLKMQSELNFEPDFTKLPHPSWIGIEVGFKLEMPWYSKDDRPFHVLDNPVRKDRVFGIPFMSAASWKGMLRWAYKMQTNLIGPCPEKDLEKREETVKKIVHLFGNEKDEEKYLRSGALAFYPTWFSRVGFEVINPHSRKTRAGTFPIYYEVVPVEEKGVLRLLYAPAPGEIERCKINQLDALRTLIGAIKELLQTYGISAKRTIGWGTARIQINELNAFPENSKLADIIAEIKKELSS